MRVLSSSNEIALDEEIFEANAKVEIDGIAWVDKRHDWNMLQLGIALERAHG